MKYDLMSAARTTMPYTGLHTDAKRSKNGYSVLVNANDLKFAEQPGGSRTAEVTILAVCYNNKGKETAQHAAEMREELAASDVVKPDSQVGFAFPMVVPPFTSGSDSLFGMRQPELSGRRTRIHRQSPPPPGFLRKVFRKLDLEVDLTGKIGITGRLGAKALEHRSLRGGTFVKSAALA